MNYSIRTLSLFVLLLSVAASAVAQSFEVPNVEYASLCELGSESRVFVQSPLGVREKIVKILREHSDLQISDTPEQAHFTLIFNYSPYAESSADGGPLDAGAAMTARAELAAVKFVHIRDDQVRPRILFYWKADQTYHQIAIPLSGLSPNGFAVPHSGKSALVELIARLALWTVGKKWRGVSFSQLSNQMTFSKGGKFEVNGTKAFLKELKRVRGDDYRRTCAPRPAPAPAEGAAPAAPALRVLFPDPLPAVEFPPTELLPEYPRVQLQRAPNHRLSRGERRHPLSRSKKARLAARLRKKGVRHKPATARVAGLTPGSRSKESGA